MKTAALDEAYFCELRELLRSRSGLIFPLSRQQDLEVGVRQAMTSSSISDPRQFMRQLGGDEEMFDALIANIAVTETYFFREPRQFEVLRREILPDLRQRLLPDCRLRIWSAGCASGEEPYSLAILVEQEALAEHTDILATDVSRPALARALKAVYGAWSLRDDSNGLVARYFDRQCDSFILQERFRQHVNFQYLNLVRDAYPSRLTGTTDMDLILCRNVLIYFDQESIRRVARKLFDSLRIGGWLITGPSDPPLWEYAPFQTHVTSAGVLYQRAERATLQAPTISRVATHPDEVGQNIATMGPPISRPVTLTSPAVSELMPVHAETLHESHSIPKGPVDAQTYIAQIRTLADRGASQQAESATDTALRIHPLCPELHYLHAIVSLELGRHAEAIASLRRVIYLDPTLALAHYTLGSVLGQFGMIVEARRTYENALALCADCRKDELLSLSGGEFTANLAEAVRAQLALIDAAMEKAR